MEDDIIKIETAKLAKEKGFNKIYFNKYASNGELYEVDNFPTQSLLQKWLRKNHNIHIEIKFFHNSEQYGYTILHIKNGEYTRSFGYWEYKTYESALEDALIYSLKLI